jgi:hypothetical protein
MYINNDLERIGIKSEDVRSIISEDAPWFIHYGTVIIAITFLLALIAIVGVSLFAR